MTLDLRDMLRHSLWPVAIRVNRIDAASERLPPCLNLSFLTQPVHMVRFLKLASLYYSDIAAIVMRARVIGRATTGLEPRSRLRCLKEKVTPPRRRWSVGVASACCWTCPWLFVVSQRTSRLSVNKHSR